ncbi:TetR/AcrR family transcriptional regulator [Amycolatopsis jiangsuensis]|uniref:AcrR family transcriptional regulator n=1 Tax=Amycolatopsis jiangsuensis TaxID=1181879 RepID=A0A840IXV7_9PSEU|nr:TetR/AcrR family transcriptional regulator [Amycolatopsis jiangsuensis]MBB4686042.1 AcrR family transcriptional regulator [Amycolatopsis jiangsuensis]
MTQTVGRRERKKAATRQALADAALRLFLERGYDAVGVREIADTADVSVTTLFKHFPDGKVALVFDEETDREAALVAAVRDRPAGCSIPAALRDHLRQTGRALRNADHPGFQAYRQLIDSTPELREYARAMWLRHEVALADAIAADSGLPTDDAVCRALAHFALEAVTLVRGQTGDATLDRIFALLEHGWSAVSSTAQ